MKVDILGGSTVITALAVAGSPFAVAEIESLGGNMENCLMSNCGAFIVTEHNTYMYKAKQG